MDRIDKVDEDRVRVVDYKTGGNFDLDRVRTDPQLTLEGVDDMRVLIGVPKGPVRDRRFHSLPDEEGS